MRRNIHSACARTPCLLREEACDHGLRRAPGVRRLAGEHFIQDRRERVDVRSAIDRSFAGCLLGAHVLRRPQGNPGLRQSRATGVRHRERDTEIRNNRLTSLEQDVLGLHVAVDHAARMGVLQRMRRSERNAYCFVDGELLLARQACAQRLAVDIRHDGEEQTRPIVVVWSARLARVE